MNEWYFLFNIIIELLLMIQSLNPSTVQVTDNFYLEKKNDKPVTNMTIIQNIYNIIGIRGNPKRFSNANMADV